MSVHLVDGQEAQLRDAADFIRHLQQQNGKESTGSIFTHARDDLKTALLDSWLVVEVCGRWLVLIYTDMRSAFQKKPI